MDSARHTEKFMGLNQDSTSSFVCPEGRCRARLCRASRSTSPDPAAIWTQAFLLRQGILDVGLNVLNNAVVR